MIKFLGRQMSNHLRCLRPLNCLDCYMNCCQWVRSIQLEKNLPKTYFDWWRHFHLTIENLKTSGETLCKTEAAAKAYAKKLGKPHETKPLKKRGHIIGCWLCLLIRGLDFAFWGNTRMKQNWNLCCNLLSFWKWSNRWWDDTEKWGKS